MAPGTTVLLAGNPMFLPRIPRSMRAAYLKDFQGAVAETELPGSSVMVRSSFSRPDVGTGWEIARSFPIPAFARRFGLTVAPDIEVYRRIPPAAAAN